MTEDFLESADCMSIVCQFLSDIRARSIVYCKGTLADGTFTSMNALFQWRTQRSLFCKHTPSIWSLDHCINIKAHLLQILLRLYATIHSLTNTKAKNQNSHLFKHTLSRRSRGNKTNCFPRDLTLSV